MGQTAEEYEDGQVIAENLIDNILCEVTRSISERKDSCFDSFENLKLQTFKSEDILEFGCLRRETSVEAKVYGSQENNNPNADACYPSLAHLPEVCIHSSSLLNTSKQGEGDFQHPIIREAVAFYRLEATEDEQESRPSGSKGCCSHSCTTATDKDTACDCGSVEYSHEDAGFECVLAVTERLDGCDLQRVSKDCNSCTSSLISASSCNELIEDLQKNINNLSFDDVHLSDGEDGLTKAGRRSADRNSPVASCSRDFCDQILTQHETKDSHQKQPYQLQQSKKFWHRKDVHNVSYNDIPANYCQLVNESYDKYELIAQVEDEQELLSNGSSEELVIIEDEEIDQLPDVNWCEEGSWDHSETPKSTMVDGEIPSIVSDCGHEFWGPSRPFNTITVVADVHEQTRDCMNWEESSEVQVNARDLVDVSEREGKDDGRVKYKQYLTSVGLVTEEIVNPLQAWLTTSEHGIESAPGVRRVQETTLRRGPRNHNSEHLESEQELEREITNNCQSEGVCEINSGRRLRRDENEIYYESCTVQDIDMPGVNQSDDNKINYLNFPDKASGNVKRKNKLIARITRSFTNLFRAKKKNPKS